MESSLADSILSVCRALNKFSVEYIIVGGTAVALHGYYRHSILDFLPELKAPLRFRASFNRREIVTLNDIEIPFVNYEDLIVDKKANARSKDITDLEQLDINRKKNDE